MASVQGNSSLNIKNLLSKTKTDLSPDELASLLSISLSRSIEYIYKNPEKKLSANNARAFLGLVKKRSANWPLAYLQGYKEFYGLKFLVNKHTLVPRPESELLVEETLNYLKKSQLKNPIIIDMGTGSGCLILSIAKNYSGSAQYWASDFSSSALKVARTNARHLGLKNKIKFIKSNLLKNLPPIKLDIIIANLPYLTREQMAEPSITKEPRSALLAGSDGLKYYKKLLENFPKFLDKKYLILLEIDPSQKDKLTDIIKKYLPDSRLEFITDLAGHIRVAKITT